MSLQIERVKQLDINEPAGPQDYRPYMSLPYTADPYGYRRRKTRVVMVGSVGIGGDHPIRVQSMTTTDTLDTAGTVAEAIRLVETGCEIVRITTPTAKDAENLRNIRAGLLERGVDVPLVADIHFNPNAAMEAAKWADKVRINPGNFADAKKFATIEYTYDEYQRELERIEQKFKPLLLRCKELGRAIRIGTNHGSLSDRIMNYYGDTPAGMVESALEFALIAEKYGFKDLIFSMKASNPKVMIQAYRLLAARLDALDMNYPFHLGVTEAGNGEDGRIKSALGIGSLLEDGIGDTIRVSLTEDPEHEIPVALRLARRYTPVDPALLSKAGIKDEAPVLLSEVERPAASPDALPDPRTPYQYQKRATAPVAFGAVTLGGEGVPQVLATLTVATLEQLMPRGRGRPLPLAGGALSALTPDKADLYICGSELRQQAAGLLGRPDRPALLLKLEADLDPAGFDGATLELAGETGQDQARLEAAFDRVQGRPLLLVARTGFADDRTELQAALAHRFPVVERLLAAARFAAETGHPVALALVARTAAYTLRANRLLAARLTGEGLANPLLLVTPALAPAAPPDEHFINAAVAAGALLTDGIGQALLVENRDQGNLSASGAVQLAFNILQAAGARSSKAEFIACPSCGRTLFNLQETTERIKARTGHLVGVKIAVMGCIVNGLGELADADFGYMGGAPGKVNLFVGKECVEKGVPTEQAVDKLVDLIKAHNRWIEPPA